MYCPNCGHEMKDDEKFCPCCGARIDNGKVVFQRETTGAEKERNREYGLICMICGILSLILPVLNLPLSIVALAFAKKCNPEDPFTKTGRITGIIGLILSIISYVFAIIYVVLLVLGIISSVGGVAGSVTMLL